MAIKKEKKLEDQELQSIKQFQAEFEQLQGTSIEDM